jgi:predicted RNA-binding protein
MIENDEQLESTKQALDLTEKALIALKKKVYPLSPQKYGIFAEPYLLTINKLRSERDHYIGLSLAEEHSMPLWIRLKGQHIHGGNVPIEIFTKFLNNFKLGVQRIAEYESKSVVRESGRPHEDLRRLCNFHTKILPGSIRIGLAFPYDDKQSTIMGEIIQNPVEIAVQKVLLGASWSVGLEAESIEKIFPDDQERYLILTQVNNFIPREGGEITSVEFNGHLLREKPVFLSAKSKEKVKEALDKTVPSERVIEEGEIREIDLDKHHFVLRERSNGKDEIRCNYSPFLEDDAKDGLDNRVKIVGELKKDQYDKEISIEVDRIDVLSENGK